MTADIEGPQIASSEEIIDLILDKKLDAIDESKLDTFQLDTIVHILIEVYSCYQLNAHTEAFKYLTKVYFNKNIKCMNFLKILSNVKGCEYLVKKYYDFIKSDITIDLIFLHQISTYATFKSYKFFFDMVNPEESRIRDLIVFSLDNSDERIMVYLLSKLKNKLNDDNQINRIVDNLFKKKNRSQKNILKRIKILSQSINFTTHLETILKFENLYSNNYKLFLKIAKYYYNTPLSFETILKYLVYNYDEYNEIINILKTEDEKLAYYCFTLFCNNYVISNFNIKPSFYDSPTFIKILDQFISLPNHYYNRILNKYNEINSHELFTKIFSYLKKNKNTIYDKINRPLYDQRKIIYFLPFLKYLPQLSNDILYVNKICFHLSVFINKKRKLMNLRKKKILLPIVNEIKNITPSSRIKVLKKGSMNFQIDKQKFTKQPPYLIFPYQVNVLKNFLLKEKADGETKYTLPFQILKNFLNYNINSFKSEFIKELNLYLIFDIDTKMTILDRYELLRNMHPYTKNKINKKIKTITDLKLAQEEEKTLFTKYLSECTDKYKWWPKAAWVVNNLNEDFKKALTDFIEDKDYISFNNVYPNDGFIITPLNGDREIKIKPKKLMTLDIKYDNGKWLDSNNKVWNDYIKMEKELENGIYRCYPDNSKFIPKEKREDKLYPNPSRIITDIIYLNKVDYYNIEAHTYYHAKKYNYNKTWNIIIKNQKNNLQLLIEKYNKNQNWLDLGCGRGKILDMISSFKNYYGFDIDNYQVSKAIKKYYTSNNIYFRAFPLDKEWDYKIDKKINNIIANFSMMHFFTDSVWEQINKVSNKDTIFIINLVDENVNLKFENNYIYTKDDSTIFYFDHIHNKEMKEELVTKDKLNSYLLKYNWTILEELKFDSDPLTKLYTWYILKKS